MAKITCCDKDVNVFSEHRDFLTDMTEYAITRTGNLILFCFITHVAELDNANIYENSWVREQRSIVFSYISNAIYLSYVIVLQHPRFSYQNI